MSAPTPAENADPMIADDPSHPENSGRQPAGDGTPRLVRRLSLVIETTEAKKYARTKREIKPLADWQLLFIEHLPRDEESARPLVEKFMEWEARELHRKVGDAGVDNPPELLDEMLEMTKARVDEFFQPNAQIQPRHD